MKNVPATSKFPLLQAALRGKASQAIGKLDNTEGNYEIVWSRLHQLFDDSYLIVQALILKLLELPKQTQATNNGLRVILDTMHDCLGQLNSYFDTKKWDPLLVILAADRLDSETLRMWETHRLRRKEEENANEPQAENAVAAAEEHKRKCNIPSWDEMATFLEQQAKIMVAQEARASSSHSRENSRNRQESNRGRSENFTRTIVNSSASRQPKQYQSAPCPICVNKQDHALTKCRIWKHEMTLARREAYITEKNLCHVCLNPNHGSDLDCYAPQETLPCPKCPNRVFHNSTICPTAEAIRRAKALNKKAPLGSTQPRLTTLNLSQLPSSTRPKKQ